MTSKKLNIQLVKAFPEIKETYTNEVSWQDGDDTGSHIVFEDVFVPFIKEQLSINNTKVIKRIFEFIENLLSQNDKYSDEVIAFSVMESLVFDDEVDDNTYMEFVGVNTKNIIKEITVDYQRE